MLKALNTAATGMAAQETNVATISNNIANINTVGFKKRRTEFDSLLYETIRKPGSRSSDSTKWTVGVQVGSGAKVSAIRKEFSQGSPKITNNPFDLMINGEGFFGILMPNQQVTYTRDGSFHVDNQGTLVTKQGFKVLPVLVFPPNTKSVHVSPNGQVDAYMKSQIEPINIGQIPVYTFANPTGLNSAGANLFEKTVSSGAAISNIAGNSNSGVLEQGSLEMSNVSVMVEMTDLIKAQRAYEMNSKVMGVADQMLQTVNQLR
ncbi:MAG: flagellar basal-body rod protein FlgG [Halobacteriovoraceae bacterium]|nr:flagellar basal-body rod protein FlgG [Halobacteriovoraceae bacterium]